MKVAIIGNCYVEAIAGCLRQLLPEVEVTPFWARPTRGDEAQAFRASIGSFDVVCAHRYGAGLFAQAGLVAEAKRFIALPVLAFTGFQPDNVVIPALRGPMGHNHSAIAVAGYLMGLPQHRTQDLFNAFIYGTLGYFDRFEQERRRLIRSASDIGFDLRPGFAAWPRPFMHDVGHPAFSTHVTVATLLAQRLSDRVREVDWLDPAVVAAADHTKFNTTWPIYPEIARRLGLPVEPLRFRFVGRDQQDLSLKAFIAASYALYAGADRTVLGRAVEPEMAALSEVLVAAA